MAAPDPIYRHAWKTVLLGAALFVSGNPAMAQNEVYRWVDDEGKVHYGAVLPPEYANRPHQILKNGIVIRNIEDPTKNLQEEKPQPAGPDPAGQARADKRDKLRDSDSLLVLKYGSEDEILEAMEEEIANLDYDGRQIQLEHNTAQSALSARIREAADRQRAGLPVDKKTDAQLDALRERLKQNDRGRSELQAREDRIRAHFMAELRRYRFLTQGGSPGEPYPEEAAEDPGP